MTKAYIWDPQLLIISFFFNYDLTIIFHPFQVRFAALQVVEAIAQRLGEEYLVLIPETVPFLAELMEGQCT